ncbi:MAG: hypothetical protein ACXWPM_07100 [Bdellovibrionota bacterium]
MKRRLLNLSAGALIFVSALSLADEPSSLHSAEFGVKGTAYVPLMGNPGVGAMYGGQAHTSYIYYHDAGNSSYQTSGTFFLESDHGGVGDGKHSAFVGSSRAGGTIGRLTDRANYQLDVQNLQADPTQIVFLTPETGARINVPNGNIQILAAPIGGYSDLLSGATGGSSGVHLRAVGRLGSHVRIRGLANFDFLWNMTSNGKTEVSNQSSGGVKSGGMTNCTTVTTPTSQVVDCNTDASMTTAYDNQRTTQLIAPPGSQRGMGFRYGAGLDLTVAALGEHLVVDLSAQAQGRKYELATTNLDGSKGSSSHNDLGAVVAVSLSGAWGAKGYR